MVFTLYMHLKPNPTANPNSAAPRHLCTAVLCGTAVQQIIAQRFQPYQRGQCEALLEATLVRATFQVVELLRPCACSCRSAKRSWASSGHNARAYGCLRQLAWGLCTRGGGRAACCASRSQQRRWQGAAGNLRSTQLSSDPGNRTARLRVQAHQLISRTLCGRCSSSSATWPAE